MSDDTVKVGPATITWSSEASEDTREKLLVKLRAIRPTARRPRTNAKAREHAEARALKTIGQPDASAGGSVMVRIYYRSMGDEILAFDAGPMSPGAASELERQYASCGPSDALGTQRYPLYAGVPGVWSGARLVTLPSQISEGAVERSTSESSTSEIPAVVIATVEPVEIPREATPPVRLASRALNLFRVASERRATRLAAWSGVRT